MPREIDHYRSPESNFEMSLIVVNRYICVSASEVCSLFLSHDKTELTITLCWLQSQLLIFLKALKLNVNTLELRVRTEVPVSNHIIHT